MRHISVAFNLLLALQFACAVMPDDNDTINYLIVNGYRPQSPDANFLKYMVSLREGSDKNLFGSNHMCGGTLISPRKIVTAAHCTASFGVTGNLGLSELSVFAKTPNRIERTAQTEELKVAAVVRHPKYDYYKDSNDVAVIVLKKDVTIDDFAATATITDIDYFEKYKNTGSVSDEDCVIIGWGRLFAKYFA